MFIRTLEMENPEGMTFILKALVRCTSTVRVYSTVHEYPAELESKLQVQSGGMMASVHLQRERNVPPGDEMTVDARRYNDRVRDFVVNKFARFIPSSATTKLETANGTRKGFPITKGRKNVYVRV